MAITKNGIKMYEGAVLRIRERYWMDGMMDEYADVWDKEEHKQKSIQIGYYGSDSVNLLGDIRAEVEISEETRDDIVKTIRKRAPEAFEKSVQAYKKKIRKGTTAEVIRGRKVKKGTILNVFWVGERETYASRNRSYYKEFENVAGAYDEAGNKVWIKLEYLKSIDKTKSPNAKERKKFMNDYMERNMREYGIRRRAVE